jgi:16S rRNA processing protein RimM
MQNAKQWIVLAQILRPQGRKGEVLADLFTDFPDRFAQHPQVWLAPSGFAEGTQTVGASDGSNPPQQFEVAAHWLPVGRNAGRIVLHFDGVETIEQAGRLSGKEVLVPLDERLPLEPGTAYISDLIGCTVYDGITAVGIVGSVQFSTSADGSRRLDEAAPLLAITSPQGNEVLVPFVNEFILGVDLAAKSIRMALPEGLAEINTAVKERDAL